MGAEGVTSEEDAGGRVEREHGVRPVQVGRHDELLQWGGGMGGGADGEAKWEGEGRAGSFSFQASVTRKRARRGQSRRPAAGRVSNGAQPCLARATPRARGGYVRSQAGLAVAPRSASQRVESCAGAGACGAVQEAAPFRRCAQAHGVRARSARSVPARARRRGRSCCRLSPPCSARNEGCGARGVTSRTEPHSCYLPMETYKKNEHNDMNKRGETDERGP